MRRVLMIAVLLAAGGCQLAMPKGEVGATGAAAENPITGDAISVTALDGPTVAAPAAMALPNAMGDPIAPMAPRMQAPTPPPVAPAPVANTAPPPEVVPVIPPEAKADSDPKAEPETPPVPEVEAAPAALVEVKTPAHLACEKKGGRWSMAGSSNASFCQTPTRDAGKRCRKETDCEGYCLARSGTCAPYTPLFGCNEILTPQGNKITQCID